MPNEALLQEIALYVRLLWVFVILVCALTGFLMFLYKAIQRAREREAENAEFSLLMLRGQEEERRRIASELHDLVLPELRRLPGDAADPAGGASQRRRIAALIRNMCERLMPPDFERLSLPDALGSLASAFSGRTGIECRLHCDERVPFGSLGAEERSHLYALVQEALTNIEKHAGASLAIIVLRDEHPGPALLLCVSDDGRGFPGGGPPDTGGGLGMRTMRRRAAGLNGTLDFVSDPGHGLMVRLAVPLIRD
ncbi:MAG: histidine kinase [Treponema sp.]|jgi:two-component system NarL family sensor kinase|nr:histidine kinase [Treponema sp.]